MLDGSLVFEPGKTVIHGNTGEIWACGRQITINKHADALRHGTLRHSQRALYTQMSVGTGPEPLKVPPKNESFC